MIRIKKQKSPYLEKFSRPVNWRLYRKQWFQWRRKLLSIPRPVAVLPKEKAIKRTSDELRRLFPESPEEKENKLKNEIATNHDISKNNDNSKRSNIVSMQSLTQLIIALDLAQNYHYH